MSDTKPACCLSEEQMNEVIHRLTANGRQIYDIVHLIKNIATQPILFALSAKEPTVNQGTNVGP